MGWAVAGVRGKEAALEGVRGGGMAGVPGKEAALAGERRGEGGCGNEASALKFSSEGDIVTEDAFARDVIALS